MTQKIFVNFPVTDLSRARGFYAALGFAFDDRFSDESSAMVVVSDAIAIMLMTREKFATFAPRPVGEPARDTSVLVALSRDSRAAVDAFVAAGLGAGGTDNGRDRDHGYLYGRSLSDPDGNVIEAMWMDLAAAAPTLPGELDSSVDA